MKNQYILLSIFVFVIVSIFVARTYQMQQTKIATATPTPTVSPTQTHISPSSSAKETRTIKIFLVAIEGSESAGTKVGCGDTLVPVEQTIPPTKAPLTAAMSALLAMKTQYYGQSGLYNALYQSSLSVQRVVIDETGKATIKLVGTIQLGGECDSPRVIAQLEETAMQFPTVKTAALFINNIPIRDALSSK
jgi:hypothetical protein